MSPWAKRQSRTVPSVSSRSRDYQFDDYSAGMDNYISNDSFPVKNGGVNKWRLAKNARITKLGEYETRKGFDSLATVPGGTTISTYQPVTNTARAFSQTTHLAQKLTVAANYRISYIAVSLNNTAGGTGTPLVELWTDNGGAPGTFITRSSIAASTLTTTLTTTALMAARFPDTPAVVAGVYWIVLKVQPNSINSYNTSSGTTRTDSLTSTDSGASWTGNTYGLTHTVFTASTPTTTDPIRGLFRATKSDGTKYTIFAVSGTVYSVADGTSNAIPIKTGLNTTATSYRFCMVNDIIYYVNGYDGYRKWDFTTESQVTTTNYSDLVLHKGLMVLVRADDFTKLEFSNFGLYETFTSTDFAYIPAPKTGDKVSSLIPLNGYLLVRTQNRCYILSGDGGSSGPFTLDLAPDQKGTYGPNTSTTDKSYNYFLSDDGMYRSNGSDPELISDSIYTAVNSIQNKAGCAIAVNKGRLYLWFASAGSPSNDSCYVWNLNINQNTIESFDSNAYVAVATSVFQDDNKLIVGSSITQTVYWQELDTNDWTNDGGDIEFELDTHYMSGASPGIYKEYRYWQPRFASQNGSYSCSCEFASDLRDKWQTYANVDQQGTGATWGTVTWGSFTWGSTAELQAQLYIPGEYRRTAVRYKHYATRQPIRFLGHSFRTQERRMR